MYPPPCEPFPNHHPRSPPPRGWICVSFFFIFFTPFSPSVSVAVDQKTVSKERSQPSQHREISLSCRPFDKVWLQRHPPCLLRPTGINQRSSGCRRICIHTWVHSSTQSILVDKGRDAGTRSEATPSTADAIVAEGNPGPEGHQQKKSSPEKTMRHAGLGRIWGVSRCSLEVGSHSLC